MLSAQVSELRRLRNLSSGVDWILMCPDLNARKVLLELVMEDITATLDGVVYAIEASRVSNNSDSGG
ncbi:hypothetical protein Mag101_07475 [Microbulbifer agarilyticus]|uniref:Uncharacterized protein n=1 Tax=Microbulbifer agarilyticus TaxID=260552 RepID=A0A1Q2M5C8_9GAMM|nr:hypothetical protein [Microbulbifer agarilyticus]AQQ67497.1 hypothetical protein Mag101_07475 [Microbulbifer agarilyticus]